ncbi:E3 ubiquitin-protein ligase TRIM56-like [Pomacea canaliculata]|uniref:E3 ubiquitin-protein ligase TRIM56-like n=1 Tax=Pomacea canaliculata TaxID=400727 RepID=UPI000D734615|nr:E3 ubiquitin-protein ligase TRIM56-like [Pomacea canaliculata]
MSASHSTTEQSNMVCAICTEVFRSPRFLPCHHTFCVGCLEQLTKVYNKHVIFCPTCRAPATVPPGGVRALQVNFYFTEEALEQARNEGSHSMCNVHTKECVIFYCTQCDQAICMRCKLTKHEGHVTEDLSEITARRKKKIEEELPRLKDSVERITRKCESFKQSEELARKKKAVVLKEIEGRLDFIVTMVKKYRTEVLQQLEEISDSLEKDLAADTQRVRNVLNSMLQLQNRACQALTSARDTDVLEMEKEMTEGEGSPQRLRNLEDGLPDTSYRLGLHSDFTNDIEGYIKRFMGSAVKLHFPSEEKVDMVNVGRCGDGERCDIHSLRQKEDRRIQVFYGGVGDGSSKEKEAVFLFTGSKSIEQEYGFRISCVTRKDYIMQWNRQSRRIFGSKNESLFYILQDCATNFCKICSVDLRQAESQNSISGTALLHPKVHKVHNFDSYKQGQLFAVVDENDNSKKRNEEKEDKMASRVVRLYSRESNDPVTTYTPPNQPFFPTDICFLQ